MEPNDLVPGRGVPAAEQHVRDFMQGDVGGVEEVVPASWWM
jgi:hypothetical protein